MKHVSVLDDAKLGNLFRRLTNVSDPVFLDPTGPFYTNREAFNIIDDYETD